MGHLILFIRYILWTKISRRALGSDSKLATTDTTRSNVEYKSNTKPGHSKVQNFGFHWNREQAKYSEKHRGEKCKRSNIY